MRTELKPLCTGVIGTGAISDAYLKNLTGIFSDLIRVKCIAANHIESAQKKAEQYLLQACTVADLLKDEEIRLVIILTPVQTHYSLIEKCLQANKHVYTEKTITLTKEEALHLKQMAEERNLYLGAAPDTFLGSSVDRKSVV